MEAVGREVRDPVWEAWSPQHVAERLAGLDVPWAVAAGWSVDLFLGRVTRAHGDLEVAVPADAFWDLRSALSDLEFDVVDSGFAYPLHQSVIARSAEGIPYQLPEIGLLFKAKHARAKDDADLAAALPSLDARRREWLAGALARVHPGHRWLRCLEP